MAIRSMILPQTRISADQGVADLEHVLNASLTDRTVLPSGEAASWRAGSDTAKRKSRRSRRVARAVMLAGLSLVMLGSTGCTMFSGLCSSMSQHEALDDFMIGHRNKVMAAKAWHCQKHTFCNPSSAFKEGFYEGYMDVANGGNGCIPSVAPSKYWGWAYQSANGQTAVNDWFAGYPMGVKAAEQDGVGHWSQVQTTQSPMYGPPMANPALMPAAMAPTLIDHDEDLGSPFVDDQPVDSKAAPENSNDVETNPIDSGLEDALEFQDEGDAALFHNNGGFSFSDSASDVPELKRKSAAPAATEQLAARDIDDVIDSIFGVGPAEVEASSQRVIEASNPAAKSARESSVTELPFSFQ
ncbi:hypothetical protein [Novipirellula artificiosorum]|uniref:Uncharacterized protein n=1 Tax=Novipirellula artificiosorum TaxID=2528016 RepID=A0A5C6DDV1_9BACT|nr:hypothetical protein [Novipirellula artificiosorum]TWU33396.1 hypothetical protein Poly41_51500 [Novipirellula artificiosorum]